MQITVTSKIPEISVNLEAGNIEEGKFFLAQGETDTKRVLYYKRKTFSPGEYSSLIRFITGGVITEHSVSDTRMFKDVKYVNIEMIITEES